MDGNRFDSVVQELIQAKTRRRVISTLVSAIVLSSRPGGSLAAQFSNNCSPPCSPYSGETCRNGRCECSGFNKTRCGNTCVNLSNDPRNCGGCGVICGIGYFETCRNGRCQCSNSSQTKCGNSCFNLNSDNSNCGGCGVRCSPYSGETCRNGRCECSSLSQTKCGDWCVNLNTDNSNCGGCGVACGFGESCRNGQCASTSVATSATTAATESAAPISTQASLAELPSGAKATSTESTLVEAALHNIVRTINTGAYAEAMSLMTDRFIQDFFGVSDRKEASDLFEGVAPIDLRSVENPLAYVAGRLSIDAATTGLFAGTRQIEFSRWFFQEEGGVYRLDGIPNLPFTESVLPGADIVDVQLFDFAIALNSYKVPADTPIIFRTTNRSSHDFEHSISIVRFPSGTTAEEILDGTFNPFGNVIEDIGGIFVESGDTADLAVESLPRGTYFLACPMFSPEGRPHFALGMVAEIAAE